ncbi:DNA phosphorothioation-associated putative methyltransferase [Methylobacterium phyllostachyos]|uniref:DNA phosphorothioation-associated putative methyltransferase n=1 Tax=Methylobacterium phyllostachyos TaxID=582672 RepID=A0A1G9V1Q7_9HYPH|nr:DNA phosphorothioation-associated putative methyltransferase [Methylobacterium phyllostachyos]SDM66221.1 DNA phosphorothioation-associated putative methyltransferase [Methylobacterium phyllostachyos]
MTRAASGPRVGKRVGGALYFHRSALDLLDAETNRKVSSASERSDVPWNVAKVEGEAVSLLRYEDFDDHAFPCLLESVRIDGERVVRSDYSNRENPPVLHRKELLLRPDDDRIPVFAALTAAAEGHGLFAASHRIGTKQAWTRRVTEAGLTVEGHALVSLPPPSLEIARHRTAIARNRLSAPMQSLVRHEFVSPGTTVLDYGCGQGDDVRALVEGGVEAFGWDPHFLPDGTLAQADAVNLGFVLNVIEEPVERLETLRRAWSYCRRVLAVAVMISGHRPTAGLRPYRDGFVTSRGTFQRYFTPDELKEMVREALGVEGFAVGLGVVFAFRDPADERAFLYRRQVRRAERVVSYRPPPRERAIQPREPLAERMRPTLDALWATLMAVGRVPSFDELPTDVGHALRKSNVSISRAIGWCEGIFDRDEFERAAAARKEDLVLYFALGAFTQSVALSDLAARLQRDARAFFGGVGKAKEAAMAFLFSLRASDHIRFASKQAIGAGIAHEDGRGGIHFRREKKDDLPLALRGVVGCASVLYGDLDDVEVVRIDMEKMAVSLLYITDFEAKLPLIVRDVRINLRNQAISDKIFDEDGRRVFLARSAYATDERERVQREAIETRVRRLLALQGTAQTVRHANIVRALKDAAGKQLERSS